MWTIFEIAVNLYQSLLCMYFLKHCVKINRPSILADCLSVLALTGFLTLYLFVDVPFSDVAGALIHFVWLMAVSDDPWYLKAFWITIKEIIITLGAGMMTWLFSQFSPSYDLLLTPGSIRFFFIITANLAFTIIFFTLAQLKARSHMQSFSIVAIFFFLNLCILIAMEILFFLQVQDVFENQFPFFASYAALSICSVLSVVLFYLMSRTAQKQRDMELALNHAQLTRQHQQVLTDMYTDFIARQHDFKHQLQTLDQLVKDGNPQAALNHLNAYQTRLPRHNAIITGCLAVDAILTAKRLECEHHQINLQLSYDPLSRLPIGDVEFCALIGNLLDNAIEGTLQLPSNDSVCWISLSLKRIQDTFFIRCTNSAISSTLRKKNGFFLSTKEPDGAPHGYGLRNIHSIVQRFDGFCSFEAEEQTFAAVVTLPYSENR